MLGIPIGLVFAYRRRLHGAVLPLVVAAAMLAVFLASPLFGLPLIGRYVRTPAVLLALFYGLAVFGWRMLPPGRDRRRWAVVGVVAAALSVAFLPWHVKMLSSLDDRLVYQGAYYRDLREVGRAPAVRAALAACGPVATADHRPIPHLRWWIDGDPGSVAPLGDRAARGSRPAAAATPYAPDAALLPRELPHRHATGRLPPALSQRVVACIRSAGLRAALAGHFSAPAGNTKRRGAGTRPPRRALCRPPDEREAAGSSGSPPWAVIQASAESKSAPEDSSEARSIARPPDRCGRARRVTSTRISSSSATGTLVAGSSASDGSIAVLLSMRRPSRAADRQLRRSTECTRAPCGA